MKWWRALKLNVRVWLIILLIVSAIAALTACQPIPRSLPPGLQAWAMLKAKKLAACVASGARGQEILTCLAEYAPDRGTYACERAAAAVTEQRSGD